MRTAYRMKGGVLVRLRDESFAAPPETVMMCREVVVAPVERPPPPMPSPMPSPSPMPAPAYVPEPEPELAATEVPAVDAENPEGVVEEGDAVLLGDEEAFAAFSPAGPAAPGYELGRMSQPRWSCRRRGNAAARW